MRTPATIKIHFFTPAENAILIHVISAIYFWAAKSSGNPVAATVLILGAVVGFVAYFLGKGRGYQEGESRGRASERELLESSRRELERGRKALDERSRAVAASESSARKNIEQSERTKALADSYSKTVRGQAQKLLDEARAKADNALADKERQLVSIVNTAQSSHPDNHYISAVLTDCILELMEKHLTMQGVDWSAPVTAEKMRKSLSGQTRQWHYEAKYYKLQTLLYESLFPELLEYSDKDSADDATPPVPEKTTERDWLSDDEYARLSSTEKSQLALDRYIASHNKSKWQVGRDYELYIGHCYRRKHFQVEHIGMEKKLADMGRDLICRSDPLSPSPETHIVQCKYWSKEKLIHEKHVMQLFGTTIEYAFAHGIELTNGRLPARLKPVLITSTRLSEMARHFAVALGVQYHENIGLPEDVTSFPRIKCNKSSGIFHLPFDEQYDVTKIVPSEGDCFCVNVAEAESKGFRRARRFYTLPISSPSVPPT